MKGIVEVFQEVVDRVSERYGVGIKYIFGSADYLKEQLDIFAQSYDTAISSFPLIALFTPIEEQREGTETTRASLNMIIAVNSEREWDNGERLERTFRPVLRKIYDELLRTLKDDPRFNFGYSEEIKHSYSENYSYGRYGAWTPSQQELGCAIDAIDIKNLKVTITQNCRTK